MKTKLFTLFLVLVTSIGMVFASDSEVNGIWYSFDSNTLTATVIQHDEYSGSVVIPQSVTYYGSIYSVTSIGNSAFSDCFGLTSVTIGNSVTSIGSDAFRNCSNLTSVTIGNSVTSIGNSAFIRCMGLTSVTIPNSVTSIGDRAFCYCSSLTSVTIGNSVTSIGNSAFRSCSGLSSVTIPNSVTSIGGSAFYGCSGLTSITIPNSVTNIGNRAFYDCSSLTSVTSEAINPPILNNNFLDVFAECDNLTSIYVPCGTKDVYQSMWDDYSSIIKYEDYPYSYSIHGVTEYDYQGRVDVISYPSSICDSLATVLAIPNDGYHFVQWNDGDTLNPYAIYLTQDTTITAIFAKNNYSVTVSADSVRGSAFGNQTAEYLDSVTISATAYYGYHFVQWSDGDTLNPRTLVLTQDTTLTAVIAKNDYNLVASVDTTIHGRTSGGGMYQYLSERTITAFPNYGYHFVQWSDSVTDNPRTLVLTQDTTFTAFFAKNSYSVTVSADSVRGSAFGNQTAEYLDSVTISATPNYGYQFAQWSDGNIQNPRTFALIRDTFLIALFTNNYYNINVFVDAAEKGRVSGSGSSQYLSERIISATANYGYHFVQWSDSVTDNPRSFVLTQDTSFTAIFEKNNYSLTTATEDSIFGRTYGDTIALYLDTIPLWAEANYGYHFTRWSDENTDNPRSLVLTQDYSLTASFEKNEYTINYGIENGIVQGRTTALYLDTITFAAIPDFGYYFVQWSDGDTINPRTFVVTQDTTFTAIIAQIFDGQCGDSLYWHYENDTLSFVGSGDMYNYAENDLPWLLLKDSVRAISFAEEMTSIGEYAFSNMRNLSSVNLTSEIVSIGKSAFSGSSHFTFLTIPNSVTSIGTLAFSNCLAIDTLIIGSGITAIYDQFYGCSNLKYMVLGQNIRTIGRGAFIDARILNHIVCYAQQPPLAYPDEFTQSRSFYNVHALVHIPCDNFSAYQHDALWGSFDLQCLSSDSGVAAEGIVTVVSGNMEATFTWPIVETADVYILQITKDEEVICTLTFNYMGQLLGIAFAPTADGSARQMPSATLTTNGMTFKVTGLDYASHYHFSFDTKDQQQQTVFAYAGWFATNGATGTEEISSEPAALPIKIYDNGHLYILLPDGKRYDATGKKVE